MTKSNLMRRPRMSALTVAAVSVISFTVHGEPSAPPAEAIFAAAHPSVCTIITRDERGNNLALGSGFVFGASDEVVTNLHVIAGAAQALIKCGDRQGTVLEVIRYQPDIDLVLIRTDLTETVPLQRSAQTSVAPGSTVYALGSPLGLEGTITPGMASGVHEIKGVPYLQISAPISHGNSGGPVLDRYGLVIGVAVGSLEEGQNLNFALPIELLYRLPSVRLALSTVGGKENSKGGGAVMAGRPRETSRAAFRGVPFGSSCDGVQDNRSAGLSFISGLSPAGIEAHRVVDAELSSRGVNDDGILEYPVPENVPLGNYTAEGRFLCNDRNQLILGQYLVSRSGTSSTAKEMVEAITAVVAQKYGTPARRPQIVATGSVPGQEYVKATAYGASWEPTGERPLGISIRTNLVGDVVDLPWVPVIVAVTYYDPSVIEDEAVRQHALMLDRDL
jgi:hypothetical protein